MIKTIIWKIVDGLNLDSLISSKFRKNRFLIKFIPDSSFYADSRRKKITIEGVNFELNPSDLVQHVLFKPKLLTVGDYGIHHFLQQVKNKYHNHKEIFVLDIGANCGQFCLLFASFFRKHHPDKKVTIHAFEPNPYVFNLLSKNLSLNKSLSQGIKPIEKGLGENESLLEIQMPYRNSGAGSLLRNYQHEPNVTASVEITSIDHYFEKDSLTNKIHFLKIDVEGFEPMVLKGGDQTIQKFQPDLYIEMGQDEESQKFIYSFLWEKGYNIYAELDGSLIEVSDKNESLLIKESGLYNIFATTSRLF